jgi:hypothetical protein
MASANCKGCGDPIRYNSATFKKSGRPTGGKAGWYHADSVRRDHAAEPHDDRSPEDEQTRETAVKDQSRAAVKEHLQKQFDYMHAESTVNDIFRDRRAP